MSLYFGWLTGYSQLRPDQEAPLHDAPDQEAPDQEAPDQEAPLKSPPFHKLSQVTVVTLFLPLPVVVDVQL